MCENKIFDDRYLIVEKVKVIYSVFVRNVFEIIIEDCLGMYF